MRPSWVQEQRKSSPLGGRTEAQAEALERTLSPGGWAGLLSGPPGGRGGGTVLAGRGRWAAEAPERVQSLHTALNGPKRDASARGPELRCESGPFAPGTAV